MLPKPDGSWKFATSRKIPQRFGISYAYLVTKLSRSSRHEVKLGTVKPSMYRIREGIKRQRAFIEQDEVEQEGAIAGAYRCRSGLLRERELFASRRTPSRSPTRTWVSGVLNNAVCRLSSALVTTYADIRIRGREGKREGSKKKLEIPRRSIRRLGTSLYLKRPSCRHCALFTVIRLTPETPGM